MSAHNAMEMSVHQWFQALREPREGTMHASWSQFCLVFSLIATPGDNVWPPRSKSARSQLSPKLSFTSRPGDVCAGMYLYRWYTGFSPASKESGCYFSQNIGPAVAGSAGPALSPLKYRWRLIMVNICNTSHVLVYRYSTVYSLVM